MLMVRLLSWCVLLAMLSMAVLWPTPAFAARHALLVGVGDYDIVRKLYGPVNDVAAIKTVLMESWGFEAANIKTILNVDGTKRNILNEIAKLQDRSQPGDEIFIYLSGHGTSAGDEDIKTPLPTTTGAFIPYDIQGVSSVEELMDRLIIGVNDLQPVLKPLDQGGRHVFVAIDACYSGNAVRGRHSQVQLPQRFVKLSDLLPPGSYSKQNKPRVRGLKRKVKTAYPYNNVYYLAASGEFEPAQDIPPEFITQYPTFTGKPHGAFTDTLVRVLALGTDADIDRDGVVTYGELKETVQREMRARGFSHTPQGLPPLYDDANDLSNRPVFGSAAASPIVLAATQQPLSKPAHGKSTTVAASQDKGKDDSDGVLTVNLSAGAAAYAAALGGYDKVKLVEGNASLFLRQEGRNILFISGAGDLIVKLPSNNPDDIVSMVKHQAWIHSVVNTPYHNDFAVNLEFDTPGRGSAAIQGDDIGFTFKTEHPSYLLMVNIDPQGAINVIYPYMPDELLPVQASNAKAFPNLAEVTPPYGRDFIQVYAFRDYSDTLKLLMGKTIEKDSPLMASFKALIEDKNLRKSRASLELVTAAN